MVSSLLLELGTIPYYIGKFLIKRKYSTLNELKENFLFLKEELFIGLSVLIQHRIVVYSTYNGITQYHIDENMISERLYFSLYLQKVKKLMPLEYEFFKNILTSGIIKKSEHSTSNLERNGIITAIRKEDLHDSKEDEINSPKDRLVVNFEKLKEDILKEYASEYLEKKYSPAVSNCFQFLINSADENNNSMFLDAKKYLKCEKIVFSSQYHESGSKRLKFTKNSPQLSLLIENMKKKIILSNLNPTSKKLGNAISALCPVEDKSIILQTLSEKDKIKASLFDILDSGIISYIKYPKNELYWDYTKTTGIKLLTERIKNTLIDKMMKEKVETIVKNYKEIYELKKRLFILNLA